MGGSTELGATDEPMDPTDDGQSGSEGPTREEIFDVLCNERRRYVLEYIRESPEESLHLGEMVETIAAWENDKEVVETDYADRKRVYTALRQTHLPKLDESGVIEYDRRRGELQPTERLEDVQLYLDYVPEHEIPWAQYYLGLSLLAAFLSFVAVLVDTTGGAVCLSAAAVVVVVFLVSSGVHTYRTRRNDVHRTPRPA